GAHWLGFFNLRAPATGLFFSRPYTTLFRSGSVPFGLQENARPGTYELRLFGGGYALLATSNSFTVNPLPTVSGTLSLGGAALFEMGSADACTPVRMRSHNAVDYSCTMPSGW